MTKRIFDFILAFIGLLLLTPLFIILIIWIKIDSKGGAFYKQQRVGRFNKDFNMYKFRSMYTNSSKKGLLTIGNDDNRITSCGYFIRKYKLDEFPQLFNVLRGDMSLVGPRPEVRKYVELYTKDQMKVLEVKPGITDLASIQFSNENEILKNQENPEQYYIEYILPKKLGLNMQYVATRSFLGDIKIIFQTLNKILK